MSAWAICPKCKKLADLSDHKCEGKELKDYEVTETEDSIEFRKKGWKPSECFEGKERKQKK